MMNLEVLNDKEEILHKNSINDFNTNNILSENADKKINEFEANINQYKSQEKILHLERGSKVCKKKCIILFVCLIITVALNVIGGSEKKVLWLVFVAIPFDLLFLFELCFFVSCGAGFRTVKPNEAIVFEYYGRYLGTLKDNGYWFGYPYAKETVVSLRSNQYNGNRLKVNERDGTPVELGIIVVWKIGDTAKAVFDVVNYKEFIEAQSEAAIRYIGCKYPYEPTKPGEISLRGGHEIINKELREELEKRIKPSGIIIEDARITEIALGSEVAQMILQKQASNATSSAKDTIVKGATNSIINSINEFERNGMHLSEEDKGKFIISMMNTLCMSSDVSKIMPNQ